MKLFFQDDGEDKSEEGINDLKREKRRERKERDEMRGRANLMFEHVA